MGIGWALSKGLSEPCSPYRKAYYFGAELNVPNADNWNCLPSVVDPGWTFDLSSITTNHEVCVALLSITDRIYSETPVVMSWYRTRDNKLLFRFAYTIPSPAASGYAYWAWWYVYSYIGYCDWEIIENGDYYVRIVAAGGVTYDKRVDFTITGIPELEAFGDITKVTLDDKLLPESGTLPWLLNDDAHVKVFFKNTGNVASAFHIWLTDETGTTITGCDITTAEIPADGTEYFVDLCVFVPDVIKVKTLTAHIAP